MCKLLPFCLNYSLLVIILANIGLSAEVRDLEILTRNDQLWGCNYEQIDAKRIELIYHERIHGLARLRLEGKQEVTGATKISDGGVTDLELESAPPEKLTNNTISRSPARDLQKLFKVIENFDADGPKLVKSDSPDITVIKEGEEGEEEKTFIYQSSNYEFVCDVKISKNVIIYA
tara:strand:+ start:9136 stop:9660 length:525 start_codon:yes stop_codon:yes gene_type:complete